MKAVKRKYGNARRQAPPLLKREVLTAIASLGQSRIEQRDRALLYAASDSWCRVSELLQLRVEDILPNEDGSSSMFISRSKTDTEGRGSYGYLSKRGTEAVRQWIETCGLEESDPIFVKSQAGARRRPLDPATVSRIFKRRTGRRDVSAHSTRVGGVQDALGIGCDLTSVMIAGRWTSPDMPAKYGRRLLTNKSAAAQVSAAIEQAFDDEVRNGA
jgi:integrase